MALYTIGDTHLSLGSDKPMDVFGGAWEGYVEKLAQGLSVLRPEDTLVIAGDISWGDEPGGVGSGFCLARCPAGKKDFNEGKPRLLVEHGGEDDPFFLPKRGFPPCTSSTTTATSMGTWPSAAPGLVL